MLASILVIRKSLGDLWGDLLIVALCNLIWLISLLLIIPGPPVTLALFYYANRRANGEYADLHDFFYALRRYWWTGWRWGLLNALVLFILAGDFLLTGQLSHADFARFAQGGYLAAGITWLLIQLYAIPFLFEQQEPSLRQALRNGILLLGRNIGFSVLLTLLLMTLLLAGTLLFLLSLAGGGAFLALAGNHAVLDRLENREEFVQAGD